MTFLMGFITGVAVTFVVSIAIFLVIFRGAKLDKYRVM